MKKKVMQAVAIMMAVASMVTFIPVSGNKAQAQEQESVVAEEKVDRRYGIPVSTYQSARKQFKKVIRKKYGKDIKITILESSKMDYDKIVNRKGYLVEEIVGIVENSDGDGTIVNCESSDYDYISYSGLDVIHVGDIILTYCLYNPDTKWEDDIIERYDYYIGTVIDTCAI